MNAVALLAMPDLGASMARVEDELRAAVTGDDAFLTEVASHLITAGGHRWRPTLAILSALSGGAPVSDEVIRGACAVELVHLGSLYHDDVMDDAERRRGVESVNSRWGNLVAILAGDFLLARASEIAASLGAEIAGLLAHTIGRLCEGQVLELRSSYQTSRTEEEYFASIAGKTGALFAASCRIGALAAALPRDQVDALSAYGQAFGTVFQMADDIADLVLTEEELGKPVGHDLVEGVYTLPVIRALAMKSVGDELGALLGGPIQPHDADKATKIVRNSGAIESSAATADSWIERAREAALPLAETKAGRSLADLGHDVLGRVLNRQ